jgi:hypothetical protein
MPTYKKKCVVNGCRKFAINEVGVQNPVTRCRVHDAGLEPHQEQIARKIRRRCVTQGCRGFAVNDEGVQNPKVHCRRCQVENPAQQPEPEVSRLDRPPECPICYETNQLVALRPCGHWCCMTCVSRLEQPICPFCRANLEMPNANVERRRGRRVMMHRPSQADRQTRRREVPVEQNRQQRPRRGGNQLSQEEWINRMLDFVTAINAMRPIMTREDFTLQQQIANRYTQYTQRYVENFANNELF